MKSEAPTADDPFKTVTSVRWPAEPPEFTYLDDALRQPVAAAVRDALRDVTPEHLGAWIEKLRALGVSAKRVGSPDLLGQLSQALRKPIQQVICSTLDSDVATCLQTALAAHYPIELLAGVELLAQLLGTKRALVVLDAAAPWNWSAGLRAEAVERQLRVEPIANPYPQADPTLLLYTLLGKRLRPGRLPSEQGVLVLDAAAAIAIGEAFLYERASELCPMAVRQHATDRTRFVFANKSSTVERLIDRLNMVGGSFIRAGALLRDMRIGPQIRLSDTESVLHVCPSEAPINPAPCTRCGWCVDVCPTRVHPATALEAAQRDDIDLAERAGIAACIECGTCTYVCPAQLPLLTAIRVIKHR